MRQFTMILIAIVSMTVLGSCEKLRQLINYDVPVEMEYTLKIPANGITEEIQIDPITLEYDINKKIAEYTEKTGIGRINSVKLKAVSIQIPEAYQYADDNLTSLSKLLIQFNSNSNTQWANLVDLQSQPTEPYFISLPIDHTVDLKKYFDTNFFHFQATVGFARATTKEVAGTFKVEVLINVSL